MDAPHQNPVFDGFFAVYKYLTGHFWDDVMQSASNPC
jgi:hypothetical protein